MEEMTMEMNNEVAETTNAVVTEGITDVTVPENAAEVPVVENSTGKIDAVQVALGGAAILGLGYLAIKGTKWVVKKAKARLKKTGKKYVKLGEEPEVVDEDEAMFEDEDLEEVPVEETVDETEEKVEG